MSLGAWELAGLGLATMASAMAVAFLVARRIHNAGIVDVAWAGGFSVLALGYAALGGGWAPRRALIGAMTVAWSLRLALHLAVRIARSHPREDGRYQELRRRWGRAAQRRLFVFFQAQALLDVVLSLPVLIACLDPHPALRPTEWAAAALWALALGGESLADRQLARFKADPARPGRTCQEGLWGLSRHPNYFFEWLVWCAYALFALASPLGLLALSAPALMLYFLLRVTGIPATEEQALRSRGDEYREYQRTTSAFVPWMRRSSASASR